MYNPRVGEYVYFKTWIDDEYCEVYQGCVVNITYEDSRYPMYEIKYRDEYDDMCSISEYNSNIYKTYKDVLVEDLKDKVKELRSLQNEIDRLNVKIAEYNN